MLDAIRRDLRTPNDPVYYAVSFVVFAAAFAVFAAGGTLAGPSSLGQELSYVAGSCSANYVVGGRGAQDNDAYPFSAIQAFVAHEWHEPEADDA